MIFFFRRKRSAWRERDARDLLRDNVHIQPSAPVMRWPHPSQVVFVSSLAPGTQAAHLMHARHWTPRKWEPRTWLRRRMDRGMQGWWFYHHFLSSFSNNFSDFCCTGPHWPPPWPPPPTPPPSHSPPSSVPQPGSHSVSAPRCPLKCREISRGNVIKDAIIWLTVTYFIINIILGFIFRSISFIDNQF